MNKDDIKKLAQLEQRIIDLPDVIVTKLDERYPTRKEYKVAITLIGLLAMILGIFDYFL